MAATGNDPLSFFLDDFVNPVDPQTFLEDNQDDEMPLKQFNDVVISWSVKVVGKRILIMHKEVMADPYLPLHQNINLVAVEVHQREYVVLKVVFLQNDDGRNDAQFAIVSKVGLNCGAQFDVNELVEDLRKQNHPLLGRWDQMLTTWVSTPNTVQRRLSGLVLAIVYENPPAKKRTSAATGMVACSNRATETAPSAPASGSMQPPSRTAGKRRTAAPGEPSQPAKKRARRAPRPNTEGGSAVTVPEAGPSQKRKEKIDKQKAKDDGPDFKHWAQLQTDFETKYKDSFLYGKAPKEIPITQLFKAKDNWVVRNLEREIIDSLKDYLITLGDIRQRQTIVVTPVDQNDNLLPRCPSSWEEIKDGKFALIDGQHSVAASREIVAEAGDDSKTRKEQLSSWFAYVVYDTDPKRLTAISEFYNTTNPLKHAQPTWGNQLIPSRAVWEACGRPSSIANEDSIRHNGSVSDIAKYKVSTQSYYHIYHRSGDNLLQCQV